VKSSASNLSVESNNVNPADQYLKRRFSTNAVTICLSYQIGIEAKFLILLPNGILALSSELLQVWDNGRLGNT
jgi:hypothetical protein